MISVSDGPSGVTKLVMIMNGFSLEGTVRSNWNEAVLTDRSGSRMLFSDLVRRICRFHIFFEEAGIAAGDRIALCGDGSLRHAAARFAVRSYRALPVEIPSDFSAAAITESLWRSDSVLLMIDCAAWSRLEGGYSLRAMPDVVSLDDGSVLRARRTVERAAGRVDALYAEQYPQGICAGDVSAATAAELLDMLRAEKRLAG